MPLSIKWSYKFTGLGLDTKRPPYYMDRQQGQIKFSRRSGTASNPLHFFQSDSIPCFLKSISSLIPAMAALQNHEKGASHEK